MDTKVADSLADHFTRAWDMILEAANHFPPNEWRESQDERMQPARELPRQKDAIRHLEQAKAKTMEWIAHFGPSGLIDEKPLWPWTGTCALAQGLYHLRHLQHHMAELAVELRRRGLPAVDWK